MSEFGSIAQDGTDFSIVGQVEEPRVAVIGCGGAGCNVIESLYWEHPEYETIAMNDNLDRLSALSCSSSIYVKPEDLQSVEELYSPELLSKLEGANIAFVVTGMGGSFGSVVAPFAASLAAQEGLTVVSICIQPFDYEARGGVEEMVVKMRTHSCATVVIDNNRLSEISGEMSLDDGFQLINRGVAKIVEAVIARIQEFTALMQSDIGDELQYEISTMSEHPSEMQPQGNGVPEAVQASLFTVHGPYLTF